MLKNRFLMRVRKARAFTLPEVIVSFSVLAMVLTSAVGLLTVVIRTNSENVNSLVANGLAQEGLEAMRFMRDSNALLGLDFDGTKGQVKPQSIWGHNWAGGNTSATGTPSVSYFVLLSNFDPQTSCTVSTLSYCLPVLLEERTNIDDEIWNTLDAAALESLADQAGVYLQESGAPDDDATGSFRYLQKQSVDDVRQTQYSRLIRLESLSSEYADLGTIDVLRVSSIVVWADANGRPRKLVLTTDLTDWK